MSVEDGIPETGQATPEPTHDWERDYKALQAEYTRSQQELKAWEDEQTAVTRFAEKFPHLMAQDGEETPVEPEYQPDEPARDPRYDEIAPTVQQLVAWQADQQYRSDLNEAASGRELSDQAQRTIKSWTADGGNNRAALDAAVKEWFALEDSLKGPERKPAPSAPQPGKAAEIDRNASKDPAARRAARRERMAAQIEAAQQ